jgi:hypothetical protein
MTMEVQSMGQLCDKWSHEQQRSIGHQQAQEFDVEPVDLTVVCSKCVDMTVTSSKGVDPVNLQMLADIL